MKKLMLISALMLMTAHAIAGPSDIDPMQFQLIHSPSITADVDSDQ